MPSYHHWHHWESELPLSVNIKYHLKIVRILTIVSIIIASETKGKKVVFFLSLRDEIANVLWGSYLDLQEPPQSETVWTKKVSWVEGISDLWGYTLLLSKLITISCIFSYDNVPGISFSGWLSWWVYWALYICTPASFCCCVPLSHSIIATTRTIIIIT